MAEYEERENRFNNTLAGRVGGFMKAVSLADGDARMQAVGITQAILDMPNVTLAQKIDILNRKDPMIYAASLPSVLVAEARPLLAETVDLEMSMTVGAHTESESSVDSKTTGSAKVSFGWGLFKGTAQMSSEVSTHSKNKRSSDYSATTDMKLHMSRHPVPEGLAKTLDAMNSVTQAANEINVAIARREVERIVNEENPQLPTEAEVAESEATENGEGDA